MVTTFAMVSIPSWSVTLHPGGELYYLTGNTRIERVDSEGVVHYFGGTNRPDFGGGHPQNAAPQPMQDDGGSDEPRQPE